jgi:UDP-N-acetylglucosamine 2-epimerase (non-hydrolysing)
MKLILVVGARPNFMKAAPILRAIADANLHETAGITPVLVHTGQHYDVPMSDNFFTDLDLPAPDIHLGVNSGSHACQSAEIMKKFEPVLHSEQPDVVVVVGDVNSTLACALVTAKISFNASGRRPLLAHVEAGLRSFDRSMPEECNRVVTDHLSDLLFVTEESGLRNLKMEGISGERVFFVGNTMIDSLMACRDKADRSTLLLDLGLISHNTPTRSTVNPRNYALLTLHRPANVDNEAHFREILEGVKGLAASMPVIFPAHPRTQQSIAKNGLSRLFSTPSIGSSVELSCGRILMIAPLGYLDFLCLMKHASLVITDSGGIQEETTCLGVPCVTVRDNTERPITIEVGTNAVAGVRKDSIANTIERQQSDRRAGRLPDLWDGHAAERIIAVIINALNSTSNRLEQAVPDINDQGPAISTGSTRNNSSSAL